MCFGLSQGALCVMRGYLPFCLFLTLVKFLSLESLNDANGWRAAGIVIVDMLQSPPFRLFLVEECTGWVLCTYKGRSRSQVDEKRLKTVEV